MDYDILIATLFVEIAIFAYYRLKNCIAENDYDRRNKVVRSRRWLQ